MSPNIGRPKSDNPKSNPIHVRLDDNSKKILDRYCRQERVAKTEAIRRGIQKLESEIKEQSVTALESDKRSILPPTSGG